MYRIALLRLFWETNLHHKGSKTPPYAKLTSTNFDNMSPFHPFAFLPLQQSLKSKKPPQSDQVLTAFVTRVIKLHVEGMPIVHYVFGCRWVITDIQGLQGGIILGRLRLDVDWGLPLSIGNGEVLMPVSRS